MQHYKRFNVVFISIVLFTVISVLALDVVADIMYPKITSVVVIDEELGWVFNGSRNQEELELGDFPLRFNSLGLRGDEIKNTPVELLLLGNSVTMGQHVPEDKTFAAVLGAVNAGQDAYDTFQLLNKYKRDLYKLEPGKVGLVVVGIDVLSERASQQRIRETLEKNRGLKKRPVIDFNRAMDVFRPPVKPDQNSAEKDEGYLNIVSTPMDPVVWDEWTKAVLSIRDAAGDGKFFIVLSPPRSQVVAYQKGKKEFWLNKKLEEFSRENDILFIDLLPALAEYNATEIYFDFVHFNEPGHAVVAGEIAKRI